MINPQKNSAKKKKNPQDHEHIIHDPVFAEHLLEKLNKVGVLVLNPDGECIYVSNRAEQILQKKKDELVGNNFFATLPLKTLEGELVEERKHPVWRALQLTPYTQVTPFFCKSSRDDGPTLALNVMQVNKDDRPMAVVVQIRVAEREVNVGEMKTLFVSFAAHQLKTPSSIVKGFLELLMREGEQSFSSDQWNYLISAFESNEHLIQVSKTLLSMARLEGGLIEPQIKSFDAAHTLEAKIKSMSSLLKLKQLDVEYQAVGEGYVNSDDTFFLEIFEIVFANAIKHSPSDTKISVNCETTDDGVTVHVIDQGSGVPSELAKSLFANVQETQAGTNSHGLGLYMAKKYLALLGGTVGVNSSKAGSDFYFTIPNAIL